MLVHNFKFSTYICILSRLHRVSPSPSNVGSNLPIGGHSGVRRVVAFPQTDKKGVVLPPRPFNPRQSSIPSQPIWRRPTPEISPAAQKFKNATPLKRSQFQKSPKSPFLPLTTPIHHRHSHDVTCPNCAFHQHQSPPPPSSVRPHTPH